METYKRPTRTLVLPSGKKVEIVTYLSSPELEEVQKVMFDGVELKQDDFIKDEKGKIIDIKQEALKLSPTKMTKF